jgi:hypothetical protein
MGPGLTAWTAGLTGAAFAAGLCCSSACADIANVASADTSGKNILQRLETFILTTPPLACRFSILRHDWADSGRLELPCLVTNL